MVLSQEHIDYIQRVLDVEYTGMHATLIGGDIAVEKPYWFSAVRYARAIKFVDGIITGMQYPGVCQNP